MALTKITRFTAEWCGPCRSFAPIFEKVSKETKYANIEFNVVDVEEADNDILTKYKVQNIPTVILCDEKGGLLKKIIGAVPESELVSIIESELTNNGQS